MNTKFVLTLGALIALWGPVHAQDLTIMSGGAAKAGLSEALIAYEKSSGQKAATEYVPMGPLLKRLGEGAAPDIVVMTVEALQEAEKKGLIDPASKVEIGRVEIGVAVNEKAPLPDIATPEAFKQTLLAAKSVVWINPATGTSGKHLAQVFEQLGIAEQVRAKSTLLEGGYVVEPVGRGEIELGLHQITEILPVKGIRLVGPLPAALQKQTIYVGAVTIKAKDPARAKALLAAMRAPEIRSIFAAKGFVGG